VNRGPDSLACLRFVKQAVESKQAVTVLGNHDMHLLAVFYGQAQLKPGDTLADILAAPEAPELCHWLAQQPLLHYDVDLNYCLVHAGLPPAWTLPQAQGYAQEVENQLANKQQRNRLLKHIYGNEPTAWNDSLSGWPRYRFIVNALTRLRYCHEDGSLELNTKSALGTQPQGCAPWFAVAQRHNKELPIVFGHWAALYDHWQYLSTANIHPVDSGCVWGHCLTAFCLENQQIWQVPCHG
jgi:bis(5'-nucleosyl)-tetraphosphatase (symmetrical)